MRLLFLFLFTCIWSLSALSGQTPPPAMQELWHAKHGLALAPGPELWIRSIQVEVNSLPEGCPHIEMPVIPRDRPTQAFTYRAENGDAAMAPLILLLQDPITELLIVKATDVRGCIWMHASGRSLPFNQRDVVSPFPNVQLPDLAPGTLVSIVIQDKKTIRPWLKIVDRSTFERQSTFIWMGLAGYCCILLVIILVAIGFDVWERNRIAAAYTLYIVTLLLWLLQNFGIGAAWLPFWPAPEHFALTQAFSVALVVMGIGVAVIEFLELTGLARKLVGAAIAASSFAFLSSAWSDYGYQLGSILLAFLALSVIVVLSKRWIRKDLAIRLFSLGFAATMLGGGLQAFTVITGGEELNALAVFAFPLGNLVQSIFWLAALGVRIRTDRRALQERLIYDATHDAVTELPNRTLLTRRLEKCLTTAQADAQAEFALMFLDIDRFKVVNDSLGHTIGDRLLQSFSRLIEGVTPDQCTIARFGGDEFLILLEFPCNELVATQIATRVLERLRLPIRIDEREIRINSSMGIVMFNHAYTQVEDILRDADTALYSAKRSGRGHFVVFEQNLRLQAAQRFELENDLAAAIKDRQFEMYYQPIVRIADNRHAGFEALVRWRHPMRGILGPGEFIPVAEETGMIRELGRMILQQTIEQVGAWKQNGLWQAGWYVSINVSGDQLREQALVDDIHLMLSASAVEAGDIRVELTETAVIANIDVANNVLPELCARGIALCMDDFGTGYSSLSYLSNLPFNVLKIDKSFIDEIATLERQRILVQTILAMAEAMNLLVVAEGIEDADQLAILAGLRCGYGQGYHFAKPMPAQMASEWLREHEK